jgi:phage-related protein/predicted XRE-type DNA-binding protein
MKAERPLKVVFFQTDTGNEPVREWLKELSKDDCKIIGTDILTVQYAWPVGKPLVDNLGDGIWEVRSRLDNRIARTLFALVNQEIVLLHGFIKKSQRTPADELELAKKRKNNICYEQKKNHRGSDFRDFLNEQGILGEVEARALKQALSLQLDHLLKKEELTKTQMAARMKTSRAAVDRLLDASNSSVTLNTLGKAARALGRKVKIELVPA